MSRGEAPRVRPMAENFLIGSVGVLCALGAVMVWSASSVSSQATYGNTTAIAVRHGGYVLVGVALAVGAAKVPLAFWRDRLTVVLVLVSLVGLVVVQIPGLPISSAVNGATRWIRVGPLGFQPSELAKLATVCWLARFLTVHRDLIGTTQLLQRSALLFVPMAGLVLLGDDLGTTLLLGVVFVVMWFLAGAPMGQVALIGAGGLGAAMVAMVVAEDFRTERIMAFLDPVAHESGAGYQVLQSRIGFASGGLWGQGAGFSRAKWGFLPEAHTDFILAVIGEELGLIGSIGVIALLSTVVGSAIVIGHRCGDPYGRLAAWGIATWFAVQSLINVGVAVGALPAKGIPLPFTSYGGTSLVVSLVAVGLLVSISRSGAAVPGRRPSRRAAASS